MEMKKKQTQRKESKTKNTTEKKKIGLCL